MHTLENAPRSRALELDQKLWNTLKGVKQLRIGLYVL